VTHPRFARSTRFGRIYTFDGIEYPSVTTIIKQLAAPALERWKLNRVAEAAFDTQEWREMPRQAATRMIVAAGTAFGERAADAGTYVHKMIEEGADPAEAEAALIPRLTAAASVIAKMGPHYASEITLVNPKHGYAGTADVVSHRIEAAQELMVTDWKTVQAGKTVGWVDQGLQLAGLAGCTHYATNDGELVELGYPITEVAVIGLRPDGSHVERTTNNEVLLARLQRSFLGLLDTWNLEKDWSPDSWM
jgi:hypothetical protein